MCPHIWSGSFEVANEGKIGFGNIDGSVSYWGTYSVDLVAGVITHRVESDIGNGYTGTDQRRPFVLTGDRLVIGDGKTWTRVLERVSR